MRDNSKPQRFLPPAAYRKFRQNQRSRQRPDALASNFVERGDAASIVREHEPLRDWQRPHVIENISQTN